MAERFAERILEAERIAKQREYHSQEKVKWLKAKCSHCGYEVEYSPKTDWLGDLKCPHCGKVFHVNRLNDFKLNKT